MLIYLIFCGEFSVAIITNNLLFNCSYLSVKDTKLIGTEKAISAYLYVFTHKTFF